MALFKACLLVLAFASAAMAQGAGYTGPLSEPSYILNELGNIPVNNSADRDMVEADIAVNISGRTYFEWQGYDGWFNNPAHPDWGGAGKQTVNVCCVHARIFWFCLVLWKNSGFLISQINLSKSMFDVVFLCFFNRS